MKTAKVRVVVTQRDINNGTRCSGKFCPIGLAVRRQGFEFQAGPYYLCGRFGDRILDIPLPSQARQFISDFDVDGRHAVKPFQFTVELPAALVRKARAKR